MISWLRRRPGLVLFVVAVLIGSAAAVRGEIRPSMVTPLTVAAVLAIIIGEQLPVRISRRVIAPLTTAPALGLILMPLSEWGEKPTASTVLAVVWLSILLGGLIARILGRSVVEGSLGSRFIGMAVACLCARGLSIDGGTLVDWAFAADTHRGLGAMGLLAAAAAGGVVERLLDSVVAWWVEGNSFVRMIGSEIGPVAGVSAATVTTGPLIALASRIVDWAAIPLFTIPVLLSYVAVHRVVTIRYSLDESLQALSRLTEVTGLTRVGHVRRVVEISCQIGQELDLDAGGLHEVERTAMLHDIGQLGLTEPLRGGATIYASAAQVEEMASAARRVIAGAPQLASVAPLVAHVGTPFRRTREFGERIPLPSRIVRVANAWDDITEGARSPRARGVALERLHLGLGYDYDPEVVSALERALALQP